MIMMMFLPGRVAITTRIFRRPAAHNKRWRIKSAHIHAKPLGPSARNQFERDFVDIKNWPRAVQKPRDLVLDRLAAIGNGLTNHFAQQTFVLGHEQLVGLHGLRPLGLGFGDGLHSL